MRGHGLAEDDVEELREAIEADRMAGAKGTSGARTQNWFGKIGLKLAASAGRVGERAGGALIAEAILRFFGGS